MSLQLPPRNIFWLVTRKYPAVTRAHFHSKLKNKIFFQYFRRQLTKFLNHVITIVTKKYFLNDHRKYTAAPRAHSHSKLNKKIFFLNIFVEIQQMLHEDVQEISLQLSPRNMATENSRLEIQFRNNIQIIIGPESDHCLPLSLTNSLTHWLTDSCLVNLIDVTLAFEDANSKLADVVTFADEDRVGNKLLQILKLRFGQKLN